MLANASNPIGLNVLGSDAQQNLPPCTNPAQELQNAVVYKGVPFSFPTVINNERVQWQVAVSSQTYDGLKTIKDYGTAVYPEFTTTYAVSGSGLDIFNATVAPQGTMPYSTAGVYIVNYENDCSTGAGFVVIGKDTLIYITY